jgi:hypothetical protein
MLAPLFAADAPVLCSTHRTNLTEQIHLHRHSTRALERTRQIRAFSALPDRPAYAADFGDIAVMDASGGVLATANPFNLDGLNLLFHREAGGLRLMNSTGSYSQAEADAGTVLALGDDAAALAQLGFVMPFFGAYDAIWVHSDGTVTFWEPDSATAARSLGRLAGGPPRIAPLFADLDPSAGGSVRVFSGQNYVTVTWLNVPLYSSTGSGPAQRLQLRLHASGDFEFFYDNITLTDAVAGYSPGRLTSPMEVVGLAGSIGKLFASGAAERFGSENAIDIVRAAQRFYENHDDTYDYLVIFNTMGVAAAPGALANMTPVRTRVHGIGDTLVDAGAEFGSRYRLQAVLNMGPTSTYPADPYLPVGFRGIITGDNTMTLLGHETGHLFLALASVRDGSARPMLGTQSAHWSFNFNSEASLLEGNRIADRGADAEFRFLTTGTVEGYSPLDQYLMGLRPPEEVGPMFAVYPGGMSPTRLPQKNILFNGTRRDISIEELIWTEGPRIPDHTVAQSRFRFAFIVITPEGQEPPASAIEKIEAYRAEFEPYFNRAAGGRAWAYTSLRPMLKLSAWPAMGAVAGQPAGVTLELARPLSYDLLVGLHTTHGHISAQSPVTIPAGQTRVRTAIDGLSAGVSDLVSEAWNGTFEPVFARIAVQPSLDSLTLIKHYVDGPVVLRVSDSNGLRYPGIRIRVSSLGATRFVDGYNQDYVTGPDGLMWLWWDSLAVGSILEAEIEGVPASRIRIER